MKMPDPKNRSVTVDLSNIEFETSEDVEVISIFDKLGLTEDLLRGIYNYGKYKNPNHTLFSTRYFILFSLLNT